MHRHLGCRLAHAAEEILEALDARHGGVELGPVRLEGRQVWAEQLDFHWPGAAREVVDDVRKNLDELDPHARERGRRPRPDLVDDLVDRPVALALGLEPDRVVAAVLQRREQAQLGAGPPTGPGHLRDPGEDAVDDVKLAIRFGQGRAARGPVIEDERPLIHLGQEAGFGRTVRDVPGGDEHHGGDSHAPRMVEHGAERALVRARQRVDGVTETLQGTRRRARWRGGVLRVARPEVALAEKRDHRAGESQRHQHGDRERDRQGVEELADHALQQAQRQEHDDGRQGGRRDRPEQLLDRVADGRRPVRVQVEMPDDILRDDDGVVDDETDGDRHGAEGHQVERLSEQPHHEDRDDERERDGRRADRGDPAVAEEEQEHNDGERGADQHGVADRGDGVAHECCLVVHGREAHARRQRVRQGAGDARHAVRDRKRVTAELARDVQLCDRSPVARDDAYAVGGAGRHRRQVAHPEPVPDDHVGDVIGGVRLRRAHHEVLPIVHRHSPNRSDGRGLADRSRELVERHPLLRQARRIGDDLDLAHVAPEHVHASDPRHPRHDRLDLVPRDVVQCGWVAALDIVRQDREERRCHPLDLDAHARRQVGHDLVDARADLLQRVEHLRARREIHVDLGAAPDGTRSDPGNAGDDTDGFLDGPRHAEQLLARAERRAGCDDRDAGEGQLGVDG